jgi:hypothetical protein
MEDLNTAVTGIPTWNWFTRPCGIPQQMDGLILSSPEPDASEGF